MPGVNVRLLSDERLEALAHPDCSPSREVLQEIIRRKQRRMAIARVQLPAIEDVSGYDRGK